MPILTSHDSHSSIKKQEPYPSSPIHLLSSITQESTRIEEDSLSDDVTSTISALNNQNDWINFTIGALWPMVDKAISRLVLDELIPSIREELTLPISISRFSLGNCEPRFENLSFTKQFEQGVQSLVYSMDFVFEGSDLDILLDVVNVGAVGVSSLKIRGPACILVSPLLDHMPIIGGVSFYFLNKPKLSLVLKGLTIGWVEHFPMAKKMLMRAIKRGITSRIVLPNRICTSTSPYIDQGSLQHPLPIGVLNVVIFEGLLSERGEYCKILVGGTSWQSNDAYAGNFLIYSRKQFVTIEVYSSLKDLDPQVVKYHQLKSEGDVGSTLLARVKGIRVEALLNDASIELTAREGFEKYLESRLSKDDLESRLTRDDLESRRTQDDTRSDFKANKDIDAKAEIALAENDSTVEQFLKDLSEEQQDDGILSLKIRANLQTLSINRMPYGNTFLLIRLHAIITNEEIKSKNLFVTAEAGKSFTGHVFHSKPIIAENKTSLIFANQKIGPDITKVICNLYSHGLTAEKIANICESCSIEDIHNVITLFKFQQEHGVLTSIPINQAFYILLDPASQRSICLKLYCDDSFYLGCVTVNLDQQQCNIRQAYTLTASSSSLVEDYPSFESITQTIKTAGSNVWNELKALFSTNDLTEAFLPNQNTNPITREFRASELIVEDVIENQPITPPPQFIQIDASFLVRSLI